MVKRSNRPSIDWLDLNIFAFDRCCLMCRVVTPTVHVLSEVIEVVGCAYLRLVKVWLVKECLVLSEQTHFHWQGSGYSASNLHEGDTANTFHCFIHISLWIFSSVRKIVWVRFTFTQLGRFGIIYSWESYRWLEFRCNGSKGAFPEEGASSLEF